MDLRPTRLVLALLALGILVTLAAMVGTARAAASSDLYDPNVRVGDSFYPCPDQPPGANRPPFVSECLNLPSLTPKQPLIVAAGETACNPNATSTIGVHRTQGFANTPSVQGPSWVNGTITWDLTATIGAQTTGPIAPEIQPFPDDGFRMNSNGFHTGDLSVSGTVTLNPSDGSGQIVAQVTSEPNTGNWGVCEGPFTDQVTGSQLYGNAPITGAFYIVNAGVLTYHVTSGPADLLDETGIAEAYFSDEFATCCNSTSPADVSAANGTFRLQFGSTHPGEGTGGVADTPSGSNVAVTNFVGLDQNSEVGGVKLTFASIATAGTTSVTVLTSMPSQPIGFQVGDPPAVYEISSDAVRTMGSTIEVCLPYGSLPAGATPEIKHYVNGAWVTEPTKSISGLPNQLICVDVTSLSPFAVGYETHVYNVSGPFQPVDPQPAVNSMKAGRTVPVKFKLGGDFGLDVFADGYPASQNVPCGGGTPDEVEATSSTNSGLSYDPATKTYQYNWKTASGWKGQCRTLILRFSDSQELTASFKFS